MPTHRRYRHRAIFVRNELEFSTPLDRNQRARLLFVAESFERQTKFKGRRNGALGYVGLELLRFLVLRYSHGKSGLCCPSIATLQKTSGRCRGAIVAALARLEASGILRIVRRIERRRIVRLSPITGELESFVGTVQTSNLYSFPSIQTHVRFLTLPPAIDRAFPLRRSWINRLIGSEAESIRKGESTYRVCNKRSDNDVMKSNGYCGRKYHD